MLKALVIVLVLAVVGGVAFVATWEIPAPMAQVEKVVPDERFER